MVYRPTSRAVGRLLKKKNKKMTKSQFCRFPYITLTGGVRATLGYFVDKKPLQKHSKSSIRP